MPGKPWTCCLPAGALLLVCGAWLLAQVKSGDPPVGAAGQASLFAYARTLDVYVAADNSFCFVCHTNYREELLACRHQNAGIGCAKCHGESNRHSSDENGITPPDIIYAQEIVDPLCCNCHLLPGHDPMLVGSDAAKSCTDCHGKEHRLKVRTRRWDKITRKLISDDGVRMVGNPAGK